MKAKAVCISLIGLALLTASAHPPESESDDAAQSRHASAQLIDVEAHLAERLAPETAPCRCDCGGKCGSDIEALRTQLQQAQNDLVMLRAELDALSAIQDPPPIDAGESEPDAGVGYYRDGLLRFRDGPTERYIPAHAAEGSVWHGEHVSVVYRDGRLTLDEGTAARRETGTLRYRCRDGQCRRW